MLYCAHASNRLDDRCTLLIISYTLAKLVHERLLCPCCLQILHFQVKIADPSIYLNADGSRSCFRRFVAPGGLPFGFVATRSLTDTLGTINFVLVVWAHIAIFLWVGAVSSTGNRCGTKSSIRMLLFTSPAAESGVNFSNHQCESKPLA